MWRRTLMSLRGSSCSIPAEAGACARPSLASHAAAAPPLLCLWTGAFCVFPHVQMRAWTREARVTSEREAG